MSMGHTPSASTLELPHLRVSLFGNCNFRCTYCPPWGENSYEVGSYLSFENLTRVLRAFAAGGFTVVKLTGGEPTLRRDLKGVVSLAAELFDEVRLITNGWSLARIAKDLKASGLDTVEVSLDAASPELFDKITQTSGQLPNVLRGLRVATAVGLGVQINMVVMRTNLDEVPAMLELAKDVGNVEVKLLELVYYEYPGYGYWVENFVDAGEILPLLERLSEEMTWLTPPGAFGSPMRLYRLPNGSKVIVKDGNVGAVYADVCSGCQFYPCQDGLYGLSITADGLLKMCKHRPDLHMRLPAALQLGDDAPGGIADEVMRIADRYRSAYYLEDGWNPHLPEQHSQSPNVPATDGVLKWYRTASTRAAKQLQSSTQSASETSPERSAR